MANTPPRIFYDIDCRAGARGTEDEHCIIRNRGASTWYVEAYGEPNAEYTIAANPYLQQTDIIDAIAGENINVVGQATGVRQI